jgi:hypothetical protein
MAEEKKAHTMGEVKQILDQLYEKLISYSQDEDLGDDPVHILDIIEEVIDAIGLLVGKPTMEEIEKSGG